MKYNYRKAANMPGVCLMVRVVGLGSLGPEFKSCLAVELIAGGIDSLSSFQGQQNEYQLAGMIEPIEYPVSEW